ncbi:hypothetical protein A6A04_19625 [Paramagnetospirillum marisnigri]|jgi:hypothetical protein|uniref:Uncharacterized protein n=1 Tax=Paramagnetospirillum marisnigri TaxID=1285242 RepID=A0A178MKW7_9PROT|nr:hypothetical protein [Paramagnetospirillum marisnigri]OAN49371.1 hypothetical protein A6A04_19625 [Paramagnetospirillum marisnigri]
MTTTDRDADWVGWCRDQAALLRRLPVATCPAGLDPQALAQEIEDGATLKVDQAAGWIFRALLALVKLAAYDDRGQLQRLDFAQSQLALVWRPGFRRHLDMEDIWLQVREAAGQIRPTAIELPRSCPILLEDMVPRDGGAFDVGTMETKLLRAGLRRRSG